jgi:transcriptional regulator with XRE-family HTH domain
MVPYEQDGRRLLERRERRGLTREEVAARSGLSCDHLTLLEWGFLPPSRRDLERLEAALGDVPEATEPP